MARVMQRVLKWFGIGLTGLAALALAGAAYVSVASERILHRKYEAPLVDITVPTDPAAVAEGERLATIRGCNGCHGDQLEGEVWNDDFAYGETVAPNLTTTARDLSPAELARAIRHGVRANGEGLQEMPSPMFYHLSDADLGKIIAYIRSLRVVDGRPYKFSPGPVARWRIAKGEFSR